MFSKKKNSKALATTLASTENSKTEIKRATSSIASASSITKTSGTKTTTIKEVRETRTYYAQTWSTSTLRQAKTELGIDLNRSFGQIPASTSKSQNDLISRPRVGSNTMNKNTLHLQNDARQIVQPTYQSTAYKSPYFNNQYHIPQNNRPVNRTSTNDHIPTYNFTKKKMAKVLVINNKIFDAPKLNRRGADIDHKSLKKTLTNLKYDVTYKSDLKASEMAKQIENFASDKDLKHYNMSILIACSHGTNNNQAGRYTEIIGTDEKGLPVEDIVKMFSNEKHTHLAGMPKILIFQCCRGLNAEGVFKDTVQCDATPFRQHGDMLIAFSTLPGLVSYRTVETGSWFIQLLCEAIDKYSNTYDIESIFKIVDEKLGIQHPTIKQTSLIENRGFKRCYLTHRGTQ